MQNVLKNIYLVLEKTSSLSFAREHWTSIGRLHLTRWNFVSKSDHFQCSNFWSSIFLRYVVHCYWIGDRSHMYPCLPLVNKFRPHGIRDHCQEHTVHAPITTQSRGTVESLSDIGWPGAQLVYLASLPFTQIYAPSLSISDNPIHRGSWLSGTSIVPQIQQKTFTSI